MPGLDRTGPVGTGSMTGRQQGMCTGNENVGFGFGGGRGRGFRGGLGGNGGGRGFRVGSQQGWAQNQAVQNVSNQQAIENEVSYLNKRLEGLKKQLQEIKKGDDA